MATFCTRSLLLITLCVVSWSVQAKTLNISLNWQQMTNWCWAATTESAIDYMTSKNVSQCQLANEFISSNCCGRYVSSSCNKGYYPDRVLRRYNILDAAVTGPADSRARRELDKGYPAVVEIQRGDSAHAMLLYGYTANSSNTYYYIWNPDRGRMAMYSSSLESYDGAKWTRFNFTKKDGSQPDPDPDPDPDPGPDRVPDTDPNPIDTGNLPTYGGYLSNGAQGTWVCAPGVGRGTATGSYYEGQLRAVGGEIRYYPSSYPSGSYDNVEMDASLEAALIANGGSRNVVGTKYEDGGSRSGYYTWTIRIKCFWK